MKRAREEEQSLQAEIRSLYNYFDESQQNGTAVPNSQEEGPGADQEMTQEEN